MRERCRDPSAGIDNCEKRGRRTGAGPSTSPEKEQQAGPNDHRDRSDSRAWRSGAVGADQGVDGADAWRPSQARWSISVAESGDHGPQPPGCLLGQGREAGVVREIVRVDGGHPCSGLGRVRRTGDLQPGTGEADLPGNGCDPAHRMPVNTNTLRAGRLRAISAGRQRARLATDMMMHRRSPDRG